MMVGVRAGRLELDEIWGYVGKKQKNVKRHEISQAADWIAAIIGKLWTYRLGDGEWTDLKPYDDYFWTRIHAVATHSTVMERQRKRAPVIQTKITETIVQIETSETAISAAFQRATIIKK